MKLIADRSPDTVYAFNTFFFLALTTQGYKRINRWTKNVDVFNKKKLLFPIHIVDEDHWVLVCVDFTQKTIKFYDSLGCDGFDYMKVIMSYLVLEGEQKKKLHFCFDSWRLSNVSELPLQENNWDCGVFLCVYAEYLARDAFFNFNQSMMNTFRNTILLEIKYKKLKNLMPKSKP